jgi:hypothetical protein
MMNVDNPRSMTVEGILEYLGRFDSVFSMEASESDIKKYIKDTLDGKQLYTYGYTVPDGYTDLLISFMNKEEVTGKDLVNLGLSIHGLTLDRLKPETSLQQIYAQFKEIAEAINKEDKESRVEFGGSQDPGGRFSAEVKKPIDDWEVELVLQRDVETGRMWTPSALAEEEEKGLSPRKAMVRLGISESTSKYRHYYAGGHYDERPEAAEERLRILNSKEFSKLLGSGSLKIQIDFPGAHSRRARYLEVKQVKGSSVHESVIETLRAGEDTKIYNPEELVKKLLGIRATTSIPNQEMDIEYEDRKVISIRSSDISEEGWKNLKNFAGDALKAAL